MLSSLDLQRRFVEENFDKENASKQLDKMKEIEKLDRLTKTKEADEENKLPKRCLYCNSTGYKHMNRHFCSPECASKHYLFRPNKNPYKPSGGKTKRKRTKIRGKGKRKSYKKQQKKRSKKR